MPARTVNDIILHELRELRTDISSMRTEMTTGFSETTQRVSVIETHTEPFFANGGGLAGVQKDIDGLKRTKYMVLGGAGVLTTAGHWVLHKLGI